MNLRLVMLRSLYSSCSTLLTYNLSVLTNPLFVCLFRSCTEMANAASQPNPIFGLRPVRHINNVGCTLAYIPLHSQGTKLQEVTYNVMQEHRTPCISIVYGVYLAHVICNSSV